MLLPVFPLHHSRRALNRFVSEQPRHNILIRDIEAEVIPLAQQYGTAILAHSPLAGGILTGKHQRDTEPPQDSRFVDEAWSEWATSFMSDNVYDVLDLLREMAEARGCTVSQLSLAWVAAQPSVTGAIMGPRTLEHLEDNLGALDVALSQENLTRIDEISPGN